MNDHNHTWDPEINWLITPFTFPIFISWCSNCDAIKIRSPQGEPIPAATIQELLTELDLNAYTPVIVETA